MRWITRAAVLMLAVGAWLSLTGSASAEDFPKGTFTLKGPNGQAIEVSFDGKGKATVTSDGEEILQCEYKVSKDKVEFSNETGTKGNPDAKPGTYTWKLTGKKLTFTKVKDESGGRAQALTFGTWEKKE